jgi:hypothetical protein
MTSAILNRVLILAAWTMLLTSLSAVAAAATPWVWIKASTTDQIINALWTASQTGTPTYVAVAPGHYRFTQSFDTGVGWSFLPPVKTTVFVIGTDVGTTILDAGPPGAWGRFFTVTKGGYLVVRNMTIMHGDLSADEVSRGGGAAANFGGFLRFDDCLLLANGTAAENGAAGGAILSIDGRLQLERVTVMNNYVQDSGGGVAILGGTAVIHDSIISGNEAEPVFSPGSSRGGGVWIFGATVTIGGSTVAGNRASVSGGGIENFGTLWLSNSAVMENSVFDRGARHEEVGGGITNGGFMRIKNGTVAANEAGSFGGGIMNTFEGRLFLRGTTIVRNDVFSDFVASPTPGDCPMTVGGRCSGGGGVWNAEGGTISTARSLLADNTVRGIPDIPLVAVGPDCGGRVLSEGYNALGDASGCDLRRSYVLHGQPTQDQIGVDPRLGQLQDSGEAGNAHFPLLPDSPLIDAGGNNWDLCTALDQIGQTRVDGNGDGIFACDIGAIEFQRP